MRNPPQLALAFGSLATEARSRRQDPETSKLAARKHEASGVAAERRKAIRETLQALGRPATPAEIAEMAGMPGLDYSEVQRRLSEVQSLGWAEPVKSDREPFEDLKVRCPLRSSWTRLWFATKTEAA